MTSPEILMVMDENDSLRLCPECFDWLDDEDFPLNMQVCVMCAKKSAPVLTADMLAIPPADDPVAD